MSMYDKWVCTHTQGGFLNVRPPASRNQIRSILEKQLLSIMGFFPLFPNWKIKEWKHKRKKMERDKSEMDCWVTMRSKRTE